MLLALCSLPSVVHADRQYLVDAIKKAVLEELIKTVSKDVELDGIRIVKGFDALHDETTYSVENTTIEGYAGRNRVNCLVRLCDDKHNVYTVRVEAAYDILADILVTSKPLASGAIPAGDDVYVMKQKYSRMPAGAITDRSALSGKTLKVNVAQGVILKSDYFSNSTSVRKGREVAIIVEGENITIATKGVLRSDAVVGGTARVFCPAPKKEINGILVSQDMVKVKI